MKFMTTLNQIRENNPCIVGWRKLLNTLGKTKGDDEPLSLLSILNSNGLDDALWCAQVFKGHDRDFRLFAVWAARQIQHLMTDPRSLNALDVAEQFANGLCDDAARAAAGDAAGDAAWDAARDAARAAAGDAAGDAAWDAARDAARAAAGDAAGDAAGAAAGAAARDAQEARLRQLIIDGEWLGSTAKVEAVAA
jgi:hypothetical protein